MSSVDAMNKPSSKSRVSARTAPEIVSDVKLAVVRLAGRGLLFRGRKLGIEGFLGSVLLEVLSLPDDQIQAILERRLPEVERLFASSKIDLESGPGGKDVAPAEREEGDHGLIMKGSVTGNLPIKAPKSAKKRDRA